VFVDIDIETVGHAGLRTRTIDQRGLGLWTVAVRENRMSKMNGISSWQEGHGEPAPPRVRR
jgi:hypothetical protein